MLPTCRPKLDFGGARLLRGSIRWLRPIPEKRVFRNLPKAMNKKSSNWYVPPDIAVLFGLFFILPVVAPIAGMLLPLVARFRSGDLVGVFYAALALGAVGTVLLFIARLPLYRKRQLLSLGPGRLDSLHRKLYWTAYLFVGVGVSLLVLIWVRLK